MAAASAPDLPDPKALQEIAGQVPGNVRLLEGAMTRVVALSSVMSEPITKPLVEKALRPGSSGVARDDAGVAPSMAAIQEAVSSVLGVPRSDLVSARRTARIARARQLAMYLARELTSLSLAQIAREFDRDHTTVLHAVRSVSKRLEPGSSETEAIHRIKADLGKTSGGESRPNRPANTKDGDSQG